MYWVATHIAVTRSHQNLIELVQQSDIQRRSIVSQRSLDFFYVVPGNTTFTSLKFTSYETKRETPWLCHRNDKHVAHNSQTNDECRSRTVGRHILSTSFTQCTDCVYGLPDRRSMSPRHFLQRCWEAFSVQKALAREIYKRSRI